jgi:hypothetical protein
MKDTEAVRSDGVEMYGLYIEAVEVNKFNDHPRRYWRYFLVNDHLYVYARGVNKKATTWRRLAFPNADAARERLLNSLSGNSQVKFILRGEPVLTQLRPTDIVAITRGQVPPARYTGQQRVESAIGKFDAAAWMPGVSS